MTDPILKATYEQMRTSILLGYLSADSDRRRLFSDAYVFAWLHRMPPLGLTKEEAVFEPVYDIPTKNVQKVFDYLNAILDRDELDELAYPKLAREFRSEDDPRMGVIISFFILSGNARSLKALDALRRDVLEGHYVERRFGPEYISLPS
jgi:hypothetical protein|nr:hypothetical protein [Neorhizobium tomejilense]